jgi:Tfp pilus assembly protein PilF
MGVLSPAGPAGREATEPIDREAYQLYLRARYHLNHRTGRLALARQYLETALERAPGFAPAHAARAEVFSRIARRNAGTRQQEAWATAEASARKALALDAGLPAAHVVLASILLFRDWDWRGAEAEYRRALAADPQDPDVCHGYATFLTSAGRMDEAIVQRHRAVEADPLNVTLISFLGTAFVFARRYDDAIREFQKALELEPDSRQAVSGLADVYARKGNEAEAAAQTIRLLTLARPKEVAGEFEARYRTLGFRAAERWLDEQNLETFSRQPSTNAWNLAFTNARLGHADAAFRWLDAAFTARDAGVLQMRVDPDVDSLRADPRFQAMLHRIGPS